MKVPFLDLLAQHAPLKDEILDVVSRVLEDSAFSGGPFVESFEKAFASYCGTRHAVAVGSGTDALWLSLRAAGVGPGDEVITSPMTFFATGEAISMCGATPVFVDIDPRTYTLDPDGLGEALSPQTRAIVPVHLFGQTADMEPILQFAKKYGLKVIEDAAQAHGADFRGKRAGTLGDAGCFSFFPGKNLGALGEGGAVVTDDANLAEEVRVLRDHGQIGKYNHAAIGWNSRMDGIQAAVLELKLRDLDARNRRRQEHAARYAGALAGHDEIVLPYHREDSTHVWHIHAIQVPDRESLRRTLDAEGIGHGVHYPVPLHLQPAYAEPGRGRGRFPVSERCADCFLSLPMFPELEPSQIDAVAEVIGSHYRRSVSTFV